MKLHKNLHVVAFVAAMMAFGAQADPVTDQQAVRDAVSAWATANGAAFADPGSAVSAEPMYDDDGTNILCWIVSMSNGGAVVASPDTDLDLVIAVIENYNGSFPAGHPFPSILKKDMRNRLAVLAQRKANSGPRSRLLAAAAGTASGESSEDLEASITAANAQWAKYGVGGRKGGRPLLRADSLGANVAEADASPYVRCIVDGFETGGRYTHWNQGAVNGNYCYNYYTPGTPGYPHAVCGCVATAGSAILQFFNCTNDPGSVTGKPTYGKNLEPAPAEYCVTKAGATDWSVLPKSYGGTNDVAGVLNDVGRELLGRVAFNVGVLVDMMWDAAGPGTASGAFVADLLKAFDAYGFTTARHVTFETKGEKVDNENQFTKTIYAQVWCGAPVILGISGSGAMGHAVVACGYARDPDGDQFCRVFMGWGGNSDGWYKFPTVGEYKLVDEAVTMIGYQDDAVVPVYGAANIPGVELELPGYVTNGVTVTTFVNANGFFGVRVPSSLTDLRIGYAPRDRYAPITPFDADTFADDEAEREDLDAAIPDEIELSILNADVRYTMESARAVAARDGKALLMVGGLSGGERVSALMEYLYSLDDTTDFSNKFVLVFNNIKSADSNRPDGDPVIGVFDPAIFVADERWKETNGRLSYEAFIDYEATEISTNGTVYTFSPTNTVALTNGVDVVLDTGYDIYQRRHSGITVTITGVNVDSGTNTPFEVTEVVPAYGEGLSIWTNGEVGVFSALGSYTNEAKGIVYSCVGWSTNEVFSANDKGKLELQKFKAGNTVEIPLASGDEFTLTWVWKASHFRVTGNMDAQGVVDDVGTAVTPSETWVAAGERVTVSAQPKIDDGAGMVLCSFNQWTVEGSVDYFSGYNEISVAAALVENGPTVSFTVNEPVAVVAEYREGDGAVPTAETCTVTLVSDPAEIAPLTAPPFAGSLAWGANTTVDSILSFQKATCTDATGGVWACTNIVVNGESYGPGVYSTGFVDVDVTCQWVPYVDPESGSDDPEPPTPTNITITDIVQAADGTWTVTVSGTVKGCWYWLYAADDLAALSGDSSTWTASLVQKVQALDESGVIVFGGAAAGAAGHRFWRARATSTEDGN